MHGGCKASVSHRHRAGLLVSAWRVSKLWSMFMLLSSAPVKSRKPESEAFEIERNSLEEEKGQTRWSSAERGSLSGQSSSVKLTASGLQQPLSSQLIAQEPQGTTLQQKAALNTEHFDLQRTQQYDMWSGSEGRHLLAFCTPGRSTTCMCQKPPNQPGAVTPQTGTQYCNSDGAAYGDCICQPTVCTTCLNGEAPHAPLINSTRPCDKLCYSPLLATVRLPSALFEDFDWATESRFRIALAGLLAITPEQITPTAKFPGSVVLDLAFLPSNSSLSTIEASLAARIAARLQSGTLDLGAGLGSLETVQVAPLDSSITLEPVATTAATAQRTATPMPTPTYPDPPAGKSYPWAILAIVLGSVLVAVLFLGICAAWCYVCSERKRRVGESFTLLPGDVPPERKKNRPDARRRKSKHESQWNVHIGEDESQSGDGFVSMDVQVVGSLASEGGGVRFAPPHRGWIEIEGSQSTSHSGYPRPVTKRPPSVEMTVPSPSTADLGPIRARELLFAPLRKATHNFDESRLVGGGGFGQVYLGHLPAEYLPSDFGLREKGSKAEVEVAVKVLDAGSRQGEEEFQAEMEVLGRLQHPNLVELLGFCMEGGVHILVYEYMVNGSLRRHIRDSGSGAEAQRRGRALHLSWEQRLTVALGAAKGLEYLHSSGAPQNGRPSSSLDEQPPIRKPCIVHRDLTSANILLDDDLNAHVSDFGLALLVPKHRKTSQDTAWGSGREKAGVLQLDEYGKAWSQIKGLKGTPGYFAPEAGTEGRASIKSDVFAYGVVLLELITGQPPLDQTRPRGQEHIAQWAKPHLNYPEGARLLLDPRLEDCPLDQLNQVAAIAAMCIQPEEDSRPSMAVVVQMLAALSPAKNTSPAPSKAPPPSPGLWSYPGTPDQLEGKTPNQREASRQVHTRTTASSRALSASNRSSNKLRSKDGAPESKRRGSAEPREVPLDDRSAAASNTNLGCPGSIGPRRDSGEVAAEPVSSTERSGDGSGGGKDGGSLKAAAVARTAAGGKPVGARVQRTPVGAAPTEKETQGADVQAGRRRRLAAVPAVGAVPSQMDKRGLKDEREGVRWPRQRNGSPEGGESSSLGAGARRDRTSEDEGRILEAERRDGKVILMRDKGVSEDAPAATYPGDLQDVLAQTHNGSSSGATASAIKSPDASGTLPGNSAHARQGREGDPWAGFPRSSARQPSRAFLSTSSWDASGDEEDIEQGPKVRYKVNRQGLVQVKVSAMADGERSGSGVSDAFPWPHGDRVLSEEAGRTDGC